MPTLLCVPIMVESAERALRDAVLAAEGGADLAEYRLDRWVPGSPGAADLDAALSLVSRSPLPCIVTCRPAGAEGGEYEGSDADRARLFQHLCFPPPTARGAHPPRYIDAELSALERSPELCRCVEAATDARRPDAPSLIISTHDFTGRPADLLRRLARMRASSAAVLKVAFRARSLRDNLELFDLLAEADRPMIALGMGEFGLMSRVLGPKFGAFLTFALLRPAGATAPGQPTLGDLLSLYRVRDIRATTRVLGVVGYPLDHSLSPAVHNAALGALEESDPAAANAVYLPLPVPPEYEHFKATLAAMLDHPRLDFAGCSVTIPHKEHLVRFARERASGWTLDAVSAACGAANTLVVRRGARGEVVGCGVHNTDATAACACLTEAVGSLAERRVAILGAGGSARAIAAELLARAAVVYIVARSRDQAERLCGELGAAFPSGHITAAEPAELPGIRPHAIVNCTPVGMSPGPAPGEMPIPEALLRACAQSAPPPAVMDAVYRPPRTPLLAAAASLSLETVGGLSMFVRQADTQFRLFTGRPPPRSVMTSVARRALDVENVR